MSQTERVFYILDLLLEKGFFTRKEVAEHFGVSIKQVYRDKEYLMTRCPLGFGNLDIVYDRERNVLTVTEESRRRLEKWAVEKALDAVKSGEKGNLPEAVLRQSRLILYKSYAREPFSSSVYYTILSAIERKKKVRMVYKKRESVSEPLRIINYGEIYYFVSYCSDGKIRTYKMSKVEKAEITGLDASFSDVKRLERLYSSYGIYLSDREEREYVIRFRSWAADAVVSQIWKEDQILQRMPDGSVVLKIRVADDTELLSRILFYGEDADVIAPDDFKERYIEKCRLMAQRYK